MEFDELVAHVIDREGGFVNNEHDRGGATNMGITQRVYSDWLASHGRQWKNVRNITRDEAVEIYFKLFWKNSKSQDLPSSVRDIHFDASVNHGVRRAAIMLQTAAGATQDGIIGKQTLKAANDMQPDLLRCRYIVARYRFYGQIVNRDRTQKEFIAGWMKRLEDFA